MSSPASPYAIGSALVVAATVALSGAVAWGYHGGVLAPGGRAASGSTAAGAAVAAPTAGATAGASSPGALPTASPGTRPAGSTASPASSTPRVVTLPAVKRENFAAAVDAALASSGAVASVTALDLTSGRQVNYGSSEATMPTASIVKADILAAVMLEAQDDGRPLSRAEKALAEPMITQSDNEAAQTLWEQAGRASGIAEANEELGLSETKPPVGTAWGVVQSRAKDQVALLSALTVPGGVISAENQAYAAELMGGVADDQSWGVSAADADGECLIKNGWLPWAEESDRWIINSIGRIKAPNGHEVLIAVMTHNNASQGDGIARVEELAKIATAAVTA
ncbi:hypothetical protein MM440_03815 [Arsenicicoccus piscis]|uniref:Beta-lactamase class A catalytic domain-containing protein n=1 Tax=Arsenicicoccus piscis TaxID=673954 RepID=A0ABQ6HLD3_9MICO|nr:serine hydrolase [Arsenicicoccus piscis]MCH8626931.1 hypothetical protein [Arsenicicoccus piscis]GMA19152.1 hypothetical protein GCM10025862_11730 [Arsenicicoccus piscis]